VQKPARRYVPAGSVYYFECQGEARLRPDLVQNAITDYGAQIGFGQVIVTNWEASS
jgi:CRISPR-associated protein Cmr3